MANQWIDSKAAFFAQSRVFDNVESFPPHWITFYNFIKNSPDITNMYDIGCGSGSYAKLVELHFPHMQYHGFDISPNAISVAKEAWGDHFSVAGYDEIPDLEKKDTSVTVANGLIEVVDNPIHCLNSVLNLDTKYVLLQRMLLTDRDTYITTHNRSYDITINESRINKGVFYNCISENYLILDIKELVDYHRPEDDIQYFDIFLQKND